MSKYKLLKMDVLC